MHNLLNRCPQSQPRLFARFLPIQRLPQIPRELFAAIGKLQICLLLSGVVPLLPNSGYVTGIGT